MIEIVNTRVLAAPPATVFAAFATPESLAQWWGPAGFTNTVPQFDFRPGGSWQIVMKAPNGAEYDNHARFLTIEPPARIVYEHLAPMHRFEMQMTYEEADTGKTKLTWRMRLERSAEHERLKDFLFNANEQNFDRLEAFLRGSG